MSATTIKSKTSSSTKPLMLKIVVFAASLVGLYFLLSQTTVAGSFFNFGPTIFDENAGNVYIRDDSSDTKKHKGVLDLLGVRIVIGIGAFAVINAVVITVHHIGQKVAKSTSTYKEIEHVYSPF